MTADATFWIAACLASAVVGLSKTGLPGLGMLAVVIFANLLPAREASGFLLPLLIVGDVVAVFAYRRHAEWPQLRRLFVWTAAGVVIGTWAMGRLSDHQARVLIGSLVVGLAVLHVWRRRGGDGGTPPGQWFAPVVGVLAGFTTLLANAAGPLMAVYLLAMRLPKSAFVGTAAVFFLLLNLFKVPFMVGLGLITTESLGRNLALAPAVLAGAALGRWLLPRVSQAWFERVALALSVVAGLRLILG